MTREEFDKIHFKWIKLLGTLNEYISIHKNEEYGIEMHQISKRKREFETDKTKQKFFYKQIYFFNDKEYKSVDRLLEAINNCDNKDLRRNNMKIRNKHDGTTIESQSLREERNNFFLRIIENNALHDEFIFYEKYGWEKVNEESNEQWHDLRKDPTDVPKDSNSVVICRYVGADVTIVTVGSLINNGWYDESQRKFLTDVIAWRELPKFQL